MNQILTKPLKKDDMEVNVNYNYQHFNAKEETKAEFDGPDIGDTAPDFTAYTTTGEKVQLSDFKGKTVVIEAGSFTCPSYIGYIDPMNKLSLEHPDIVFLVLYVREAHPGSKIGPHQSLDEKIELAKKLKTNDNENRTILIDDLNGSVHSSQILLPNYLYIVDKDGVIAYKSEWNNPKTVEKVLNHLQDPKSEKLPRPKARMPSPFTVFRVMKRGGWNAIFDMMPGMPRLMHSRYKLKKKWKKDSRYQ